jgi:hypothetical protein
MNTSPEWTPEAIRSLGPTTDLLTLGAIFGVSRWTAYEMRRDCQWEQIGIKIIPVGTHYRVTVQSILTVLGYSGPDDGSAGPPESTPRAAQAAGPRSGPGMHAGRPGAPS